MEKDKISVIVPVYNVEKYIRKCVDSLIQQNYKNIEIILVDDGSPDNSSAILDKFATEDERVKVIHKTNGGVSSARNAGLDIATGEYIMFVDGDDWVEPDYVSYFCKLIKLNGCFIGMGKNNFYMDLGKTLDKMYTISAEEAIKMIYMEQIFVAVWNKIYNATFLKNNNLRFDESIWFGEGMLFNIECLQFLDKVTIGEKSVYHQTVNPNSAMRAFDLNSNFCGIHSLHLQKKKWLKVNDSIENAWAYHKYCFNRSIIDGLVRTNTIRDNKATFYECRNNIRTQIWIPLKADITRKRRLSWIAYAICPILMSKRAAKKYKDTIKKWGG